MKIDEERTLYLHPALTKRLGIEPALLILQFHLVASTSLPSNKHNDSSVNASSNISLDSSHSMLFDYYLFSSIFNLDPLAINPIVSKERDRYGHDHAASHTGTDDPEITDSPCHHDGATQNNDNYCSDNSSDSGDSGGD